MLNRAAEGGLQKLAAGKEIGVLFRAHFQAKIVTFPLNLESSCELKWAHIIPHDHHDMNRTCMKLFK